MKTQHRKIQTFTATAVLVMLTLFGAVNAAAQGNWSSDPTPLPAASADGTIYIETAGQLAALAKAVNAGNTFSGTIVLANDINMSACFWTPIGNKDNPFMGTFNGNGKTITGIIVNPADNCQYAGFFGYVGEKGEVRNLKLDEVGIVGSSGRSAYAGGLVGYNDRGTIEECEILSGAVNANCITMGSNFNGWDALEIFSMGNISINILENLNLAYAGGVIGFNNSGKITNCNNKALVAALAYTSLSCAGGVVGYNGNGGTVDGCTNSGAVKAKSTDIMNDLNDELTDILKVILVWEVNEEIKILSKEVTNMCLKDVFKALAAIPGFSFKKVENYSYAGGVVGKNMDGSITNCSNSGSVKADATTSTSPADLLSTLIDTAKLILSEGADIPSINVNTIDLDSHAGGVAGWNTNGTVENCQNSGLVDAYSYNMDYATIFGIVLVDLPSYTGGIAGYDENSTITNSINSGGLNTQSQNINILLSGGNLTAYAGGMSGLKKGGAIKNCANCGTAYAYSINAGLASANITNAYAGGMAGILNGNGTIENCMSRGAVKAKYLNFTLDLAVYIESTEQSGGVVGRNEKGSSVINCYWMKNQSSGFNNGAFGKNKGTQINCFPFDNAPGSLSKEVNPYGSKDLRYVLDSWASNNGCSYWRWKADWNTDGGYPFLAEPATMTVTFNSCGGSTTSPPSKSVTYGYSYDYGGSWPEAPTYAGKDFDNWWTAPGGSGTEVTGTTTVTEEYNHTLFAHWVQSGSSLATDMPLVVNGTCTLETEGNLRAFVVAVNSGTDFSGVTIALGENIVVTTDNVRPWTPIGENLDCPFSGTFDGQGHTISGININNNNPQYAGLFGCIGDGGKVQNVNVEVFISDTYSGTVYVGGIAGLNNGDISNCKVNWTGGTITTTGKAYVGGVTGYNSSATIENCSVNGTIYATSSGTSSAAYAYVGGVAGYNGGGSIQNCTNNSAVTASAPSNYAYAGGIAGYSVGETVANCVNSGTVIASSSSSFAYSGGVAGYNSGGTIEYCANSGLVNSTSSTGETRSGGVAGYNSGTVENCINSNDVKGTATNNSVYAGGVVGYNSNGTIQNCINSNGTVTATSTSKSSYSGGVAGYSGGGIIQECINNGGSVTATTVNSTASYDASAGGIVGYKFSAGIVRNCSNSGAVNVISPSADPYSGGVVGFHTGGIIDSSMNSGNVTVSSNSLNAKVGGVAGSNSATITACSNSGTVTVATNSTGAIGNTTDVRIFVGGVAGVNDNGTIQNCSNTNAVKGNNNNTGFYYHGTLDSWVGGVAGQTIGGNILNCSNSGAITSSIVVNTDWNRLFGPYPPTWVRAGGIAGEAENGGTIQNCMNIGATSVSESGRNSGDWYSAGVVAENKSSNNIKNCYWKTGTGYASNAVGKGTVATTDCRSFTTASGTSVLLNSSVTVNGAATTDLKTALNYWQAANGSSTYSSWASVNNGYPYLDLTTPTFTSTVFTIFNGNEGNTLTQTLTYTLGSTYDTLPIPERTGYTFKGWFTAATGGTQITSSSVPSATLQTLYAQWTLNTYTVVYNGNGETDGSTASSNHIYGTEKTLTPNGFRKTGYTFAGWATSVDGGVEYEDEQSVLNLMETVGTFNLYANWKVNTYTVTFNANGDETSEVVTYGDSYGTTPNPTRTGYVFAGWWTSDGTSTGDWGTQVTATSTMTTANNQKLFARWTPICRVTLIDLGAEVSSYVIIVKTEIGSVYGENEYGVPRDLPTPEQREGYDFAGWFTSVTGTTKVENDTPVMTSDGNVLSDVLYAQWTVQDGNTVADNWADHCVPNWGSDGIFEIRTPGDLAQFAYMVNVENYDFSGKTVKLMNDLIKTTYSDNFTSESDRDSYINEHTIPGYTTVEKTESTDDDGTITYMVTVTNDLSMKAYYWTPTGKEQGLAFTGTFDGQGHTIQGISIDDVDTLQYAGLFGYIGSGGEVKNVNLVDTTIIVANEGNVAVYIGSVAGMTDGGRIENCTNNGAISVYSNATSYVGGVVGENLGDGITMQDCMNNGTVEAFSLLISHVGGIAGLNYGNGSGSGTNVTIDRCSNNAEVFSFTFSNNGASATYSGGVVGQNTKFGTIDRCSNSGHVSGAASINSHAACIGGVAGENQGFVRNSVNSDSVSAFDDYNPVYYAGGVVGFNTSSASVINCLNSGAVSASFYVGGVVGFNVSYIDNCLNIGEVNASNDGDATGGVVGFNSGNIVNSFWKQDGVDGFTDDSVGEDGGADGDQKDVSSFGDAPGTLAKQVGETTDLLTALQNWVPAAENAGATYLKWDIDNRNPEEVDELVNDGYPFLVNSAPAVTSVSPTTANVGDTITITGTSLNGATVTIGDVTAEIVSNNGATLEVKVPANPISSTIVITTPAGSVTDTQNLTVYFAPTIITPPQPQTVNVGGTAIFTVSATGNPDPTYQWQKNGTPITSATNPSYTIANVRQSDDATYTVVVANGNLPDATSAPAALTVIVPPEIAWLFDSGIQTVQEGDAATFAVNRISGSEPFTYTWTKNGTLITSATTASYTTPPTIYNTDNNAIFTVTAINSAGTATLTGTLTVNPSDTTRARLVKEQLETPGPATINIDGVIDLSLVGGATVTSGKTIIGASAAPIISGDLTIPQGTSDVVIQGVSFDCGTLNIDGATGVEISNCIFSDVPVSITGGADNITFSWNSFNATSAGPGSAMTIDNAGATTGIFLDHNFFGDGLQTDIPAVTNARVLMTNNYITAGGAAASNTAATIAGLGAQILSVRNIYQDTNNPLTTQDGGLIRAIDNFYTNVTGDTAPGTDTVFVPADSYLTNPTSDLAALITGHSFGSGASATPSTTDGSATITATVTGDGATANATGAYLPHGGSFTLTANPAGFTPVPSTYQWYLDNFPIPGATDATYAVAVTIPAEHAGSYSVEMKTPAGEIITSGAFTVTIEEFDPPTIISFTTDPATPVIKSLSHGNNHIITNML